MSRKTVFSLISALILMVFSLSTFAAALSPVGTWTTISDKDKKERGVVRIWISKGVLYGKIIKTHPRPGDKGICVKCTGKRKNQKIKGMTILWGLKKVGTNKWSGGRILDPENGKIYKVSVTVKSGGKKLAVRGYIGFSMLGRTQTWHRRS